MIGDIVQPTHLLFILIVALVVLGPKRLPEVGRSLGRGLRDFKNALSTESSAPEYAHLPEPYPAGQPEHEAPVSEPPVEATVSHGAPGGAAPAADPVEATVSHDAPGGATPAAGGPAEHSG